MYIHIRMQVYIHTYQAYMDSLSLGTGLQGAGAGQEGMGGGGGGASACVESGMVTEDPINRLV